MFTKGSAEVRHRAKGFLWIILSVLIILPDKHYIPNLSMCKVRASNFSESQKADKEEHSGCKFRQVNSTMHTLEHKLWAHTPLEGIAPWRFRAKPSSVTLGHPECFLVLIFMERIKAFPSQNPVKRTVKKLNRTTASRWKTFCRNALQGFCSAPA